MPSRGGGLPAMLLGMVEIWITLALGRMSSSKHEARRAYRAAAKAAHPDTNGSAHAFRAVSGAFERLARGLDPEVA